MYWMVATGFAVLAFIGYLIERRLQQIAHRLSRAQLIAAENTAALCRNVDDIKEMMEETIYPDGRINVAIEKMAKSVRKDG